MAVSNRNHGRQWYLSSTSRCNVRVPLYRIRVGGFNQEKKFFFFLLPWLWFFPPLILCVCRQSTEGWRLWMIDPSNSSRTSRGEKEMDMSAHWGDPIYIAWSRVMDPPPVFRNGHGPVTASLAHHQVNKAIYLVAVVGPYTAIQLLFASPVERERKTTLLRLARSKTTTTFDVQ